jgi:predicted ester cyclase
MSHLSLVRRAVECFNDPARRSEYFDLYRDDVVLHAYDGDRIGIESLKAYYTALWNAFPDAYLNAEDMIEQGDKLVLRYLLAGTHKGPILGFAGTGKHVRIPGITVLRFEHDKCVERWSALDTLVLLLQIGARPTQA